MLACVVRSFFLFLSRRKRLRRWMETSAPAKRLARRFVAAIHSIKLSRWAATSTPRHCHHARSPGRKRHLARRSAEARDVYLHALSAIHDSGIQGNVSLKLTQFGSILLRPMPRQRRAARAARAGLNNFVRVDMESSQYTQRPSTWLRTFTHDTSRRHGDSGLPLSQPNDIEELCRRAIRVRLCKGAYLEPASAAFPASRMWTATSSS